MQDVAIKVENVSKLFKIGAHTSTSLRDSISHLFRGVETNQEDFWALRDISFEVKQGDAIGIIGKNGAGKSTLLKILSRIVSPTTGKITINGRVASLLEVGTGFHPELTGRENIYLNGTILGMKRAEIKAKFDEIVDFSGVEKFIDTPVKHYSSGMYVRLAFAVAAHLEPEILIIDEVLAVGDAEFQKKCLGKMEDVSKKQGRTVLFVSHNMQAINTLCSRAIVLKEGQNIFNGMAQEAVRYYYNEIFSISSHWKGQEGDDNVKIKETWVKPLGDNFFTDIPIEIGIVLETLHDISNLVIGFHLYSEYDSVLAYSIHNDFIDENVSDVTPKGEYVKKFVIPENTLAKGNYYVKIDVGIHDVKQISNGNGDLYFTLINRNRKGCRYPVRDIKGYASLFRPDWAVKS